MTARAFVAYPLTSGVDLAYLERFVRSLRERLAEMGWEVLPSVSDEHRMDMTSSLISSVGRLSSNVTSVAGSDVLIVLLSELHEPTSVWVELGIALAAGRRVVVVGPREVRMPYLARLALEAAATDPTWARRVQRVEAVVPPEQDPDPLVGIIAELLGSPVD